MTIDVSQALENFVSLKNLKIFSAIFLVLNIKIKKEQLSVSLTFHSCFLIAVFEHFT